MRPLAMLRCAPLLLGLLPGCEIGRVPAWPMNTAAFAIGAVPVIGRTLPDAALSAVTGRDCSVVRLDRGQSYCRPTDPPPEPPPYCTRSLGTVDCWRQPPVTMPARPGVANGRYTLTAEQEAYRTRRWPNLW